jgi:glucan biosynthesis protein C
MYNVGILLRALVCLSWIFTIIGFSERYLNYTNARLKYCNEAVLPFYILHQPVIVLIGYFVVQWPISIGLKYGIIAMSSFVVIALVYVLLVRRLGALRFMFGMGPAKKP